MIITKGGWAGWGAAKALCQNGCKVTLLDSLSDPAGKLPILTPTGRPYEPGHKGFWIDYPNIISLLSELNSKYNDYKVISYSKYISEIFL
jgi:uncharacterized protein with NAD-binding domain and iron-sulfur cluster